MTSSLLPPPLSDPSFQSIGGRFYVVTGGTQGLGLEIARTLKHLGSKGIVLVSRNRELGAALEKELSDENCCCRYVHADLSKASDAESVIPRAIERLKEGLMDSSNMPVVITGVVNAAAITSRGNLMTTSASDFDMQMNVNCRAPFLVTQAAAKHMMENKATVIASGGGGSCTCSIVNIASVAAHGGAPFIMPYSVSKAALVSLTKNNAAELAPHGIRCNAINMGWTLTDNENRLQTENAAAASSSTADGANSNTTNWVVGADASCPLKRILRPRDVACTACFLLSQASAMMTGSVVDLHPEYANGLLGTAAEEADCGR